MNHPWTRGIAIRAAPALLALLASCHSDADGSAADPAHRSAATPPAAPASGAPLPATPPVAGVTAAPKVEDVATVVDYLLRTIRESGLTFIRNGDEHTAAEAADHIRDKYEAFKDGIKTPEDFIARAATSSMFSGKPYLVKTADGKTRPVADWLTEVLAAYRAAQVPAR